jgi:hypothetical protein
LPPMYPMLLKLRLNKTNMNITQEDLKNLKRVRNYFGEHDKTLFEHRAYSILDSLLRKLEQLQQHGVMQGLPYYQLCPKCLGEGQVASIGNTSSIWRTCPVCWGAKTLFVSSPTVADGAVGTDG